MSGSFLSTNSNISSLKGQRQLATATSSLSCSFEKLSSGLRINKASDDAAGLAVASSLRADTRIYSQGIRNLNDGVSALNIADGAISNLSSIVIRMEELAEQSANGAVGSKQRHSLDAEAQALAKEYFRISRTTDFNGIKLLDGSTQGVLLQAGYGSNGAIISSLGGALGTGTFQSSFSYATESGDSYAISIADLNGDGLIDLVTAGDNAAGTEGRATVRLGNGDGTFCKAVSYDMESGTFSGASLAVALSDLNGDCFTDLVTAGHDGNTGRATIRLGRGDGSFGAKISYTMESYRSQSLSISDLNDDGIPDLVTAGGGAGGQMTVRLGNGNGTFRKEVTYETELQSSLGVSLGDLNADGVLDAVTAGSDDWLNGAGVANVRIGNGDGSFRAADLYSTEMNRSCAVALGDLNSDGILDLATAGLDTPVFGSSGRVTLRLGNGDGTFRGALSYRVLNSSPESLSLADLNGDGNLDLTVAGEDTFGVGWTTTRLGNGDGTFRKPLSFQNAVHGGYGLAVGDLNSDGALDAATAASGVSIGLAATRDGVSPILPFSLRTQAKALQALPVFAKTLERLTMQRGQIGAFQSRLSSALNTLSSTVLQYKGAQSRVEDVDIASESADLVRQQIVQQAASSVLAQANQTPSLALTLLRG